MKSAFTLPEILVAILVLAVGILGLASSGTFIVIQSGDARAIAEGSALAGRALDSLRSIPCHTVAAGQLTLKQATVRWAATPANRSVAVDAVLELRGKRARQWPIKALLPCER
jgi:prepilin-type N-terminal cleavage/methylation domain-containing protein